MGTQGPAPLPRRRGNTAAIAKGLLAVGGLVVGLVGGLILASHERRGGPEPGRSPGSGQGADSAVEPTNKTSIQEDLARVDSEIRDAEAEDAKYAGGLVKALTSTNLEILRGTRAMLQQK